MSRPWGTFESLKQTNQYNLKEIIVKPTHRLSLQNHQKRSEHWIIIQGNPLITLDDKVLSYKEGDTVLIGNGTKHRIENIEQKDVIIIEVQTGTYFGEDDIIRIKDDYNRI